jgi:hypothetical protein
LVLIVQSAERQLLKKIVLVRKMMFVSIFKADDYRHPFDQCKQVRGNVETTLKKGVKEHMKTKLRDGATHATSRCSEYNEMVNIFRPLIVQNLLVHDILPSLPFLGLY